MIYYFSQFCGFTGLLLHSTHSWNGQEGPRRSYMLEYRCCMPILLPMAFLSECCLIFQAELLELPYSMAVGIFWNWPVPVLQHSVSPYRIQSLCGSNGMSVQDGIKIWQPFLFCFVLFFLANTTGDLNKEEMLEMSLELRSLSGEWGFRRRGGALQEEQQ